MWLGRGLVVDLLVPAASLAVFLPAWAVSSLSQPLNSLAFLTDGAHLGTGDYRFLRNAMGTATIVGVAAIWGAEYLGNSTLTWIWIATALWVIVRAAFGMLRIWPGFGNSDFKVPAE
jgi:MATE family multidrug resistance protein